MTLPRLFQRSTDAVSCVVVAANRKNNMAIRRTDAEEDVNVHLVSTLTDDGRRRLSMMTSDESHRKTMMTTTTSKTSHDGSLSEQLLTDAKLLERTNDLKNMRQSEEENKTSAFEDGLDKILIRHRQELDEMKTRHEFQWDQLRQILSSSSSLSSSSLSSSSLQAEKILRSNSGLPEIVEHRPTGSVPTDKIYFLSEPEVTSVNETSKCFPESFGWGARSDDKICHHQMAIPFATGLLPVCQYFRNNPQLLTMYPRLNPYPIDQEQEQQKQLPVCGVHSEQPIWIGNHQSRSNSCSSWPWPAASYRAEADARGSCCSPRGPAFQVQAIHPIRSPWGGVPAAPVSLPYRYFSSMITAYHPQPPEMSLFLPSPNEPISSPFVFRYPNQNYVPVNI